MIRHQFSQSLSLRLGRRRAPERHRRSGERRPVPLGGPWEPEGARGAGIDAESAGFMDAALRAAVAGSGRAGLTLLRWAESDPDGVTLVWAVDAVAPAGFVALGERRWRTTATLDELVLLGRGRASPTPALVLVGLTDGDAVVLIDLESSVTTVVGDSDEVLGLLQAVAVAASTAPWSDQAHVMLVGNEVLGLDDRSGSRGDIDRMLDEVISRRDAVADDLGSFGFRSIAEARASGVMPNAWAPLIAVLAEPLDREQLDRVRANLHGPTPGVAVVLHGAPDAEPVGRCVRVKDGELTADWVDGRLWCRDLDCGPLRQVAQPVDEIAAPGAPAGHSATARHPALEARQVDASVPTSVLDALLQDVEVVVHVLGEVRATAPLSDEPVRIPKQKALEALTYLALRDSAVDREELQAALWPAGNNSLKTFHNMIWAARKALSALRPDSDLLPEPTEGRYALAEGIVTDYGLFSELTSLADEREDAREAAQLLAEALTLVNGEPFVGGGRGYAWVAPHTGLIVAQVVDAAEELAEVRLAAEDWRGAEWAARQGLKACPYEERMYRLLMRTAFAAGSLQGVRRAFDELTSLLADPDDEDAKPHDLVHPDTASLLAKLTRSPDERRSA